tara:strand:+ start:10482 stop:11183 length:702 start_codon:yes stop_codon:yes gene_type:complete
MRRLSDLSMNKKGQSLLESFLLFILILGLVMPLLFFSADYVGKSFRMNQAEDSLRSVAITANAVSNLGSGSSNVAVISVPNGVQESYSSGNSIIFIMDSSEISTDLNGKVIGKVPKNPGFHEVQVRAIGEGKIKIGNVPYILQLVPPCVVSSPPGSIVNIEGFDFVEGSVVYSDGEPIDSSLFQYVHRGLIELTIDPSEFSGSANGKTYLIQVSNPDGQISNSVELLVKSTHC